MKNKSTYSIHLLWMMDHKRHFMDIEISQSGRNQDAHIFKLSSDGHLQLCSRGPKQMARWGQDPPTHHQGHSLHTVGVADEAIQWTSQHMAAALENVPHPCPQCCGLHIRPPQVYMEMLNSETHHGQEKHRPGHHSLHHSAQPVREVGARPPGRSHCRVAAHIPPWTQTYRWQQNMGTLV